MSEPGVTQGRGPLPEVSYVFDGDDGAIWTVISLRLQEGLSELFEAELILASDDGFTPDGLLGGPASLQIHRALLTRGLRGVVRFVEDLGSTATQRLARVGVVPRLWLLSQRVDSRIFQDMHAVEIVCDVLQRAGVYQEPDGVEKGAFTRLPKREYCVQYRESDLDFVLRLLQEEGIPFYFKHERDEGETLVLVDDPPRYGEVPTMDGAALRLSDASMNVDAVETLGWFDVRKELRPTGMTVRDYDFTHPRATREMTSSSPTGDAGGRPQYLYPARSTLHRYDEERAAYMAHDGAPQAKMRHERNQVAAVQGRGRGNVTGLMPGMAFGLAGHQRGDADEAYLVVRVEHRGQAWGDIPTEVRASEHLLGQLLDAGVQDRPGVAQRYVNRFEVVPRRVVWRPPSRISRPIVQGPQTARVVGPEGEEIHTDPHGRIKVQFHWDREGEENERSSCWVRVQQNWAGSGWGFQFIPRIGMEVVVTFLEGDPDRPLVTGCVYNGENGYPYGLPGSKTQSGVKTNSSATNGGFNELRFEDRAGEEQLYVQAQRNMDTLVKNEQTIEVGGNRTMHVHGRNKDSVDLDRIVVSHGNALEETHGGKEVSVHGEMGARYFVDNTLTIQVGARVTISCGESQVSITTDAITITSPAIYLKATGVLDAKGQPIRLNCGEST
jgi:type VI secretion system secreted protein VgrG